ncbi:hypothetical protein [Pseudomonas sp. WC2]|uniref:hypothetical protein n=1 Tax=Pseudomonas sp. WC2 TaxID=3424773 RepID=UPI003D329D92
MKRLNRPFSIFLALTFSLNATALSLRSELRPDGTTALLLSNEPAAERAPKLNQDPAVRSALVDFLAIRPVATPTTTQ